MKITLKSLTSRIMCLTSVASQLSDSAILQDEDWSNSLTYRVQFNDSTGYS